MLSIPCPFTSLGTSPPTPVQMDEEGLAAGKWWALASLGGTGALRLVDQPGFCQEGEQEDCNEDGAISLHCLELQVGRGREGNESRAIGRGSGGRRARMFLLTVWISF